MHAYVDVSIMQVCTHAWIQRAKTLTPKELVERCDNDRLFQMCCCGPVPGPPRAFDILDRIVAGKDQPSKDGDDQQGRAPLEHLQKKLFIFYLLSFDSILIFFYKYYTLHIAYHYINETTSDISI